MIFNRFIFREYDIFIKYFIKKKNTKNFFFTNNYKNNSELLILLAKSFEQNNIIRQIILHQINMDVNTLE